MPTRSQLQALGLIQPGEKVSTSVRQHRMKPVHQKTSTPAPAAPANAPEQAPSTGRAPVRTAAHLPPRTAHKLLKVGILRLTGRLMQLRAIDVAVAFYADRPLKNALSGAQRTVGVLVREGLMQRYMSDSGQTYYGMTAQGARWLQRNGDPELGDHELVATTSRVGAKKNPEHDLWANFFVLACEARGITALNEAGVRRRLGWVMTDTADRTYPLAYIRDGKKKGLLPDAMAFDHMERATWIEIDRSERGGERLSDLAELVRGIGMSLGGNGYVGGKPLYRVVVMCKHHTTLNRNINYLTGQIELKNGHKIPRLNTEGGHRDQRMPMLHQVAPGLFQVWAYVLVDSERKDYAYEQVGELCIQMLPTWLPKLTYNKETRTTKHRGKVVESEKTLQDDGWFHQDYLPWTPLPGTGELPPAISGFDRVVDVQ